MALHCNWVAHYHRASKPINLKKHPPDSKVHGANMGSIWGRQDPGGPHVGPMNLAIGAHGYGVSIVSTLKHVFYQVSTVAWGSNLQLYAMPQPL